jgi:tetraacyldisaccharide 4'-kinase
VKTATPWKIQTSKSEMVERIIRMLRFKKKVESIIYSSGNPPMPSLALLLQGLSFFYGAGQKLRATCYRHQVFSSRDLPCKVISVGNITVGGTGKTPLTIYVAAEIKRAGFNVVIVSRGYKGRAEKHGGIVSDGRTLYMNAEQAGDEPYMIACRLKGVPVIVGKSRYAAGMLAIRNYQPDVIVLDDAFQHLKLKRDIDLVLLDCRRPLGNSYLLPRGELREPASSLSRSAACILTRCGHGADDALTAYVAEIQRLVPGGSVFTSSHVPYWYVIPRAAHHSFEAVSNVFTANEIGQIKHRKFFCFSGIARNEDFRHTLKDIGVQVTGALEYSDHHPYTEKDLATILRCARNTGADGLITTEKDHARITSKTPLPLQLIVVGVRVSFGDAEQEFISFIKKRIQSES